MSIAVACSMGLASAAGAQQFDGRYLGSLYHIDQAGRTTDRTSHLYDIIMRQDTPNKMRFDLGASLRYDSEFSYDSDIFRARTFGELRSRSWRLHGQFTPWQRTQPSSDTPSRRDLQLGLNLTPLRAPHVFLNYTRADRRNVVGESRSDDARAEIAYGFGPVDARVGYRYLEREPGGRGAKAFTNEYRGGLQARQTWNRFNLGAAYDAILTRIDSRERQVDQDIQRAVADATWSPARKLIFGANALRRWGKTRDNAARFDVPIDETNLGARVNYLPVEGLSLSALRAYTKSSLAFGNQISDYLRLETMYRRVLLSRTTFHTGYLQTIDIDSQGGGVPNSTVFVTLDGDLRRGLWARAESRAARSPQAGGALQWFWLFQVRTEPSNETTLEVLWNRNSLPEIDGLQQKERTWEVRGSYDPRPGVSLVGTYRRLDGEGRLERQENLWTANGSWRVQERTTVNFYGSARRTSTGLGSFEEDILGADLTLRPRQLLSLRGTWRYGKLTGRARDISYGLVLTKQF